MPPGPLSPASMPRIRNTSSSGAPNRIATRLDMMPASTNSEPSRMPMLSASRAAMVCDSLSPIGKAQRDSGNDKHAAIGILPARAAVWRRFRAGRPPRLGSAASGRNIADHCLADLVLAHHHLGGAVLREMLDFALGMGTRDDRKGGVELACLRHDLPALEGVG